MMGPWVADCWKRNMPAQVSAATRKMMMAPLADRGCGDQMAAAIAGTRSRAAERFWCVAV